MKMRLNKRHFSCVGVYALVDWSDPYKYVVHLIEEDRDIRVDQDKAKTDLRKCMEKWEDWQNTGFTRNRMYRRVK